MKTNDSWFSQKSSVVVKQVGSKYTYVKVYLIPREAELVKNKKEVEFALQSIHQWRRSAVLIANFEQISQIVLVFPLLTLNE